jgi:hypothetical protein
MVRITVGRSGDQFIGKIEARERVHRRHFEGVVHVEIRKQARDTLRKHGLPDTRRTVEEHAVPTGRRNLAGPLGLGLPDHICQVETTVRVLTGSLADDVDGFDQRHWYALQEGDQLGDRGNTEDIDPFDEFRLSGLPQGHDHPGEACLLGGQCGGQDSAYRTEATVQAKLAQ